MRRYLICLTVALVSFGVLIGQNLSPEKEKAVIAAIKMPPADFSINIFLTEHDIQPSKPQKDAKPKVEYPDDQEGLWEYITLNHVLIAEPYLKLVNILKAKSNFKEAEEALNKGLQRMSDALNVDMSQLELANQASLLLAEVYDYESIRGLWEQMANQNMDNAQAWTKLAFWEVLSGDKESGKIHLNKAYSIDPTVPEIYVTAFSLAMYSGIEKIGSLGEEERSTRVIQLMKSDFLDKAVAEHPKLECAVVTRLALSTISAFWETTFMNSEKFDLKGPVKMEISNQARSIFSECRKYFSGRVKGYPTPILPLKLLLMDAAVSQLDSEARTYYSMAVKAAPKDYEVHRIMGFYYVPQFKLTELAQCMEADLAIHPNLDGFKALASVWFEANHIPNARVSLEKGAQYGLPVAVRELYEALFLWRKGEIKAGVEMFEQAESDSLLEYFPDLNYYRGVFNIFSGDLTQAIAELKQVDNSSFFDKYAKAMLKIVESK